MKGIMVISILMATIAATSVNSVSAESQYGIPSWVKGVAGLWSEGQITDKEFGDAISFLVDNDIIKVSQILRLENKIEQLDFEKKQLLQELQEYSKTIPVESIITVSTDRATYDKGEDVTVFGKVTNYDADKTVSFVVRDAHGKLVTMNQITPDSGGVFTHSFYAGGALWDDSETYSIEYTYGDSATEISFIYNDPQPYAEAILVTTDKVQYTNGEIIQVSGRVSEFLEGTPIGIRLYDPYGELVKIVMTEVNPDNTFDAKITANGKSFINPGIYTIKTIQGAESRSAKVPVEFVVPSSGVKEVHFTKPLYTLDEHFVFTGMENEGNQSVYVIIYGPYRDLVGTTMAMSSEDGTFVTEPKPVSEFFTQKGHYIATAFTDEQNATNGVTMKLEFDGNYVAEAD